MSDSNDFVLQGLVILSKPAQDIKTTKRSIDEVEDAEFDTFIKKQKVARDVETPVEEAIEHEEARQSSPPEAQHDATRLDDEIKPAQQTSNSPKGQFNISPSSVEHAKLRLRDYELRLPAECQLGLTSFVFKFAYHRFVTAVQELNGNYVTRKKMESAWRKVILSKAKLWKADGTEVKEHKRKFAFVCSALKMPRDCGKAWPKSDISQYWADRRNSAPINNAGAAQEESHKGIADMENEQTPDGEMDIDGDVNMDVDML